MQIQLTKNNFAEIDDDDFEVIKNYKWVTLNSRGRLYAISSWYENGVKKHILMHRLILGVEKGMCVDHIDGNGLNNKKENIRICSHGENMRNSKPRKHSQTGIRGVRFDFGKYFGRVYFNKKRYQKVFSNIEDAAKWASEKRKELHGEFAYDAEKDSRV